MSGLYIDNMISFDGVKEFISDIDFCIAGFDISESHYNTKSLFELGISGNETNKVFFKGEHPPVDCIIAFSESATDCKIFFDEGVTVKGSRFSIKSEGNIVYVGKKSTLNKVSVTLLSKGDFVLVGEGVSVTAANSWSTGYSPGKNNNGIIIGDHCLMASEIIIRPADGHMIMDAVSTKQINISHGPIIVEPYCWIGQRAAILKNVRIGACSIISLGAVVTKSCEKFSALGGVPASARNINGKMWLRNQGKESKRVQQMYLKRFFDQNTSEVIAYDKIDCLSQTEELLIERMRRIGLCSLVEHITAIKICLDSFDIDELNYKKFTPSMLNISGDESNLVYIKGEKIPDALAINFGRATKNARVYIGDKISGSSTRVTISGDNGFIYIGNNCRLNEVSLSVVEDDDSFIIGNDVTSTAANMWTTGHYSGAKGKTIIIGDDCMFSYDITVRASDGHPIFMVESMTHINIPENLLVIEPHCWIGQGAFIGKNVKIGACSIIAASAVVTKSCERFSIVSGIPGSSRSIAGKVWGRNLTEEAKDRAKYWYEYFKQ